MAPLRKILVAVDGSQQAFSAVQYASKMFPPDRTAIHLLYVHTTLPEPFVDLEKGPPAPANDTDLDAWNSQIKKDMTAFMEISQQLLTHEGFPPGAVTYAIEEKKKGVARDILMESRGGYDALIVGRTGGSRFKYFILGSITNKLAEVTLDIPLVIVGGSPTPQKLLIGFDGSEAIMNGLVCIASLIDTSKCQIRLCHVVRMLNLYLDDPMPFSRKAESDWLEQSATQVMPRFNRAKDQLIDAGVAPKNVFIEILDEPFSRAGRIVKEAETREFGTIVTGRRGLSVTRDFPLGRVSTKILHLANKSALWLV